MQRFIVEYQVGDGYTLSFPEMKAVEAESKEDFLAEFENMLIAYDSSDESNTEHFKCCGQIFEFRDHVYHTNTKGGYDYALPDVYTFEEWSEKSINSSGPQIQEQLEILKRRLATAQHMHALNGGKGKDLRVERYKKAIALLEQKD